MSNDFKTEEHVEAEQGKKMAREAKRAIDKKAKEAATNEKRRRERSSEALWRHWKASQVLLDKSRRIVMFKQRQDVMAKQQESMDKHLEFLVGQTERYSNMLANNLSASQKKPAPPKSKPTATPPSPIALSLIAGKVEVQDAAEDAVDWEPDASNDDADDETTLMVADAEELAMESMKARSRRLNKKAQCR